MTSVSVSTRTIIGDGDADGADYGDALKNNTQ